MKPYFIVVFLITALFCSNNASPMTHKRLINVAILLDDHGLDVAQAKISGRDGPILATLKTAIKSRSSFIFVAGALLQQYSQSADLEENFDQAWEIYESKEPKASLFILIPETYKNKVIAEWKKSTWTRPAKKLTLEDNAAALGLNIYDRKHFKKHRIEDIRNRLMPERSKSVPAIKAALVKNKRGGFYRGFFNFYLNGHGEPTTQTEKGVIASLSIDDYQDLIQFLQKNCSVNLLVVLSCYGGGRHLFTSYPQATQLRFLKRDFLIVHYGTTDNPIHATEVNFVGFFQNIEKFEQKEPGITLEAILLSLYIPEGYYGGVTGSVTLGNTPYALLPNSQIIVPINIFPREIIFLTYTKVMAHYFANKTIAMKGYYPSLFLFPSLIPAMIQPLRRGGNIVSAFPGSSIHFLKGIDITTLPMDPLRFIRESFVEPAARLASEAQKIFIIKKLKYKDGSEIRELNNIVLIIPGADTTLIQVEGGPTYYEDIIYQLAYEQSVNNKHLYVQAEVHGNLSQFNHWMVQGFFQHKPIQKSKYESAKESFDLITNAIKKPTLVGYLETDPQTIRQFPLLAGQKDYRSLIINMASLMDSKLLQEQKELNPWDFVWGKVGFLQPPPILPKGFGIRYPEEEPIAKRREKQKFFQDLSDKIDHMLNKELFLRTIALFLAGEEVLGKPLLKVLIQEKQVTQQQTDALFDAGLELFPKFLVAYTQKGLLRVLIDHNVITKQQLVTAKKVFSADGYQGKTLLETLINNKLITKHDVKHTQTLFAAAMRWYSEDKTFLGSNLLKLLLNNQLLTQKQITTLFDTAMAQIKTGEIGKGLTIVLPITGSKQLTPEQIKMLFTTAMTWLSKGNAIEQEHGSRLLEALITNKLATIEERTALTAKLFDTAVTQFSDGKTNLLDLFIGQKLVTPKQIETLFTTAMKWLSQGKDQGRSLLFLLIRHEHITKSDTEKIKTMRESVVTLFKRNKALGGRILLTFLIAAQLVTKEELTALTAKLFDTAVTRFLDKKDSALQLLIEKQLVTPKQIETLFTIAMKWLLQVEDKTKLAYGRMLLEALIENKQITRNDTEKLKTMREGVVILLKRNKDSGEILLRLLRDNYFDTEITRFSNGKANVLDLFISHKLTPKQIETLFTTAMKWLLQSRGMKEHPGIELLKLLIENKQITRNDTEKLKTIRESVVTLLKRYKDSGETILNLLIINQLATKEELTALAAKLFDTAMRWYSKENTNLLDLFIREQLVTPKQFETLFTTAITWIEEMFNVIPGIQLLRLLKQNEHITKHDTEKIKTIRESVVTLLKKNKALGEGILNLLINWQLLPSEDVQLKSQAD